MEPISMYICIVVSIAIILLTSIRIVRPTHKGLIERLGRYRKLAGPGFQWIIPLVNRLLLVNLTKQMVVVEPQEIISNDNLNASVDAQVYFWVKFRMKIV